MSLRSTPFHQTGLCYAPRVALSLILMSAFPSATQANALTGSDWAKVRPMLQEHCYDCHGGKKTKGGVDLKKLDGDPLVGAEFELWNKVLEAVKNGDMPPDDKPMLPAGDKNQILHWVHGSIDETIRARNWFAPGRTTHKPTTSRSTARIASRRFVANNFNPLS